MTPLENFGATMSTNHWIRSFEDSISSGSFLAYHQCLEHFDDFVGVHLFTGAHPFFWPKSFGVSTKPPNSCGLTLWCQVSVPDRRVLVGSVMFKQFQR